MGRSSICSLGTDFNSRHWLSLDPCGLICLSFSYSLHFFALFASAFTLIAHHTVAQILYGTLYVPFSLLSIWSLTKACGTDPGAVPLGARPIPANLAVESDSIVTERDGIRGGLRRRRGIRRCRKCNDNYKPARAHHDSVTGRCVVKMDREYDYLVELMLIATIFWICVWSLQCTLLSFCSKIIARGLVMQ